MRTISAALVFAAHKDRPFGLLTIFRLSKDWFAVLAEPVRGLRAVCTVIGGKTGRGEILNSFQLTSRAARFSVLVAITALVLLAFGIGQARAASEPTCMPTGMEQISTDATDYAPGSTVQITGVSFAPACDLNVSVMRPEGIVDTLSVSTDLAGSFALDYALPSAPSLLGSYYVSADGADGISLASTTFATSVTPALGGPTITSDKDDYAPGEAVLLSGSGWQPGEAVHINVNDDASQTWNRDADVTAAEDGTLTYQFNLPDTFAANYLVTATGEISGTAKTRFNDTINFGSSSSNANSSGGASTIVINKPASVANDDLLVAGITVNGGNNTTITAPSGWILIERTNAASSDTGTDVGLATYYHVVTNAAGEPATSYSWGISSSNRASGGILRYTGVDTSNPIDVHSEGRGNSSSVTAPSVSTTAANDLVIGFFSLDENATFAAPGGMSERYDVANTDSSGPTTEAADYTQATAAATGNKTATASQSNDWVAQLVALRMAVSGGGGGCPTATFGSASSVANSSSGASTIVITKPAAVANDDVLVAGITVNGGTDITITPPSGWTLIRRTNNGGNVGIASYYHVVTSAGSEPVSYSWGLATSGATRRASGGILRYTGVDTANPIDVDNGGTGSSSSPTAPTVTTTAANDLVVGFFGLDENATFTAPGGMNERYDVANTDSSGPTTEAADYTQASAGATGTKAASATQSNDWAAQLVALNSAPCSGGCGTISAGVASQAANSSGGASTIVITKPASVANDDALVAGITVNGGTNTTITAPSGWTQIRLTILGPALCNASFSPDVTYDEWVPHN
jgi:hypothetical protein